MLKGMKQYRSLGMESPDDQLFVIDNFRKIVLGAAEKSRASMGSQGAAKSSPSGSAGTKRKKQEGQDEEVKEEEMP